MSLIQMSLSGAAMVLVTVVIRALALHRLPKRAFMAMWGVALVRLLVPYSLPSPLSVYSLWARLVPAREMAGNIPDVGPVSALPGTGAPVLPGAGTVGAPAANFAPAHVDPLTVVWLAGVLACAVYFAVVYFRCRREFRASLPVDNARADRWLREHPLRRAVEIRQSDRVAAPLTYGVLRPVILMPGTTDWEDWDTLQYVLAHEYVHIRRWDALTKLVLTAAVCVHWFNPAVWLMYVLANRDMELSCDETVIRQFGERTRAAYAMALIRMEEAGSGLTPLYSNFSKNAIEERIIAIMKIKKTSLAASFAAAALVLGVTTAFATTGQTARDRRNTVEDVYLEAGDPSPSDVEWWTAEEYAAWLENEKEALQSVIGSWAYTGGDGWFRWTQEKVDETIRQYEKTLEDIQRGVKISKPFSDGGTMVMYGFNDEDLATIEQDATVTTGVAMVTSGSEDFERELLAEYEKFGLIYEETEDALYFHGEPVRYFYDGVDIDYGTAVGYEFLNRDGVVDVYTVRKATVNPDGSTDPMGVLVSIKACGQVEFDRREFPQYNVTAQAGFSLTPPVVEASQADTAEAAVAGVTFADRFAKYEEFGITYVEAKGASGAGNVYLNGRLVSRFADITPDGGAFSFSSPRRGGLTVRTIYDSNGRLAGVETVTE